MSNLRKAAEQALDVGETTIRLLRAERIYAALTSELDEVCDAIRAALAEPDEVAAAVKAEREACIQKIREELDQAERNTMRLEGQAGVRVSMIEAALDWMRARGGDVSDG